MGTIFIVFGLTWAGMEPTTSQSQCGRSTTRPLSWSVSLWLPVFFSLHLEGVFQPVQQLVRELAHVLLLSQSKQKKKKNH